MKKQIKLLAASLAAITAMSCTSATTFADKIKTVDGVRYLYVDIGQIMGAKKNNIRFAAIIRHLTL